MDEIRVFLFLLNHFHFLGEVLWIGLSIEVSICSVSVPIATSSELVREIGIVIFFWLFGFKFIRIGAFAPEREVASCVLISGLYILIIPFMSRKLG
jgi:hypothetical protein